MSQFRSCLRTAVLPYAATAAAFGKKKKEKKEIVVYLDHHRRVANVNCFEDNLWFPPQYQQAAKSFRLRM